MGVYLSSPITDKESVDGQCDRFIYGASSMQGWRITQEDAHNCIPLFDEKTKTSFFAVYDGHGGAEVAKYCEKHFPEFVKTLMDKKGDTEDPASFIKNAFLEFDETLTQDDVIKELKELAGKDDDNEEEDECDPVGRSEAELLKEEANMPLDQLLAQYKCLTPDRIKNSHDSDFQSPALRAKSSTDNNDKSLGQDAENGPSSSVCTSSSETSSLLKLHKPNISSQCFNGEENKSSQNDQPQTSNSVDTVTDSSSSQTICNNDSDNGTTSSTLPSAASGESSSANKTKNESADNCSNSESACTVQPGICTSSQPEALTEPTGSATETSSSQDSDDGPSGSGTSPKTCKSKKATENAQTTDGYLDTSDDEDEDDDDEEDLWEDMSDDEEDDDDEDEEEADEDVPMMNMSDEEPGSDSGCTACVVLMQGKKLIVANAGDSRCVLSRAGKAVELSFDHKPEDDSEKERIENAGGKVTADGRVNGGLNLSRAIGDHVYKRRKDLPPEEQMITALPDVETTELCNKDQFIVIACDGIWNYMSSQEVVDFVLEKFKDPKQKEKPSAVCEALFDHCLAPNTAGDGTGCDNMTCIIVVLDTLLNPEKEQSTAEVAPAGDKVVKNAETNLEKQLSPVNERGDAGSGGLKRCADNVEVREKKRVKVEEEVV
ncbi:hypothetical protein BsWGS_19852 [Bradybaena similaris]